MQSYVFDFKKNPSLMSKWNKEFDVEDIGTNCFYIVLVDDICDDNFADCLDDGQLRYSDGHTIKAECSLEYVINNNAESIVLDGDVTIDFADEEFTDGFKMKGAFLTTDSGYILGYSINQFSINITTQMIFEDGLTFFDVIEGGLNGEQ